MTHYTSAVYEPTDPDMPLVAVILDGINMTMAFTVSSVLEDERNTAGAAPAQGGHRSRPHDD